MTVAIHKSPPKRVKLSDLDEKRARAFATPQGFGRYFLGYDLSPRQEDVLASMAPNGSRVSVLCCNEAGKTTRILPSFILWHLSVFPRTGDNGGVVTTSGSWSQIKNQLVPALKGHAHRFPRWDFNECEIKIAGIPNWMAFSTRDAGRAEGFHGSPDHPLAALIDEGKSVRDAIFRTVEDRCRPQRTCYLSSPGYAVGEFYNSHTSNADLYTRHTIKLDDCPWIDRNEMQRVISKAGSGDYEKGLADPLVRSAYFAEFMAFVEGGLISLADIEDCLALPPQQMHGDRHVFCDFAAGGDENVIAVRNGNRVRIVDAWRDKDTMSAVGRFIVNFQKLRNEIGLKSDEIEGDADGLGRVMVDRIRECGWPIMDFHGGAGALDGSRFKNRASECWHLGVEAIKGGKAIIPDDGEMKAQMVDRQAKFASSGHRWLESKDDLFKRQRREQRPKRSPDRADAVFGAMAELPRVLGVNLIHPVEQGGPWANDPDINAAHEEATVPAELLKGFDAGG